MLSHPSLEKLRSMRLFGMESAFREQLELNSADSLSFEERLALLIDREQTERENRRFTSQLKKARLRQQASLEDIDYRHSRGLDRSLVNQLASCQWLAERRQLCITGATGTGKTYLACAFAHRAIAQGYTARYYRLSRLLQELSLAKGDGRYLARLGQLAKIQLLILDDWGLDPLAEAEKRILLEILDDRFEKTSTLITSQLPTDLWHSFLADPTLADAILDRILHSAYRIELSGESLRKRNMKDKPSS